jgi:hypothetical protein
MGFVMIPYMQKYIKETITTTNLMLARQAANEIELYLERALNLLEYASLTPEIKGRDIHKQDFSVNLLAQQNLLFYRVAVLDTNFQILTKSYWDESPHSINRWKTDQRMFSNSHKMEEQSGFINNSNSLYSEYY